MKGFKAFNRLLTKYCTDTLSALQDMGVIKDVIEVRT